MELLRNSTYTNVYIHTCVYANTQDFGKATCNRVAEECRGKTEITYGNMQGPLIAPQENATAEKRARNIRGPPPWAT